jgi:hypothetical protein
LRLLGLPADAAKGKEAMNCGLSNLATLKAWVLPVSLQSNTSYNTKLAIIGGLAAGLFNQFCNRTLQWGVAQQDIFTGDRPEWYVAAYPIATNNDANQSPQITSVNMRYFLTDNWTNIVGEPLQVDATKGKIHFGYTLGRAPLQVQVIYNGGYFYETLEPTDEGYPTAQPAGSTALPPEVLGAFLVQCAEVWNKLDKLGAGIAMNPDTITKTGVLDFSPLAKRVMQAYVRYQMS